MMHLSLDPVEDKILESDINRYFFEERPEVIQQKEAEMMHMKRELRRMVSAKRLEFDVLVEAVKKCCDLKYDQVLEFSDPLWELASEFLTKELEILRPISTISLIRVADRPKWALPIEAQIANLKVLAPFRNFDYSHVSALENSFRDKLPPYAQALVVIPKPSIFQKQGWNYFEPLMNKAKHYNFEPHPRTKEALAYLEKQTPGDCLVFPVAFPDWKEDKRIFIERNEWALDFYAFHLAFWALNDLRLYYDKFLISGSCSDYKDALILKTSFVSVRLDPWKVNVGTRLWPKLSYSPETPTGFVVSMA
ncbi:hypothetical protein CL633_01835 [bacterium]|nr:hypothetical protein [bacterium]